MTCEYVWVAYGWHTSTYEWHTDDIRVHTSDIRMTYEYIQVTNRRHAVRKKNKVKIFKAFRQSLFKISDLKKNSLHVMAVLGKN